MNIYRYILVLSFAFLAPTFTSEAQLLDKLQKRAEKRVKDKLEQKAERKVDKTVDNALEAPEKAVQNNKKPKKSKESAPQVMDLNSMLNASGSIKLSDRYEFSQKVVYEMKDGVQGKSQTMTYWFGADEQVFGIEMGQGVDSFIVYDLKQDAMLMFSQKDKKVQVLPMNMLGAFYDNTADDDADFTFKKADGTKKISGYNCQKYVMISATMEGEFWFSKEVDLKVADFSKTFLSMAKKSKQSAPKMEANPNGFMMEMNAKDKSTNAVTQMTVKELSKTQKIITTSTYKKQ